MSETVTLREYFEARLSAMEKALQLQAVEYGRRLDELNHAHEKSKEDRLELVTRNELSEAKNENTTWRNATQSALDKAAGAATARAGMLAVLTALIAIILNHFWR